MANHISQLINDCCDSLASGNEIAINCRFSDSDYEIYHTPLSQSVESLKSTSVESKNSIKIQTLTNIKKNRITQSELQPKLKFIQNISKIKNARSKPKIKIKNNVAEKFTRKLQVLQRKTTNFTVKQEHYRIDHIDCPFQVETNRQQNYRECVHFERYYSRKRKRNRNFNASCQTHPKYLDPGQDFVDSSLQTQCDYDIKLKESKLIGQTDSEENSHRRIKDFKKDKREEERFPHHYNGIKETESDEFFDAEQFQSFTKAVSFNSTDTDKSVKRTNIMCAYSPCNSSEFIRQYEMTMNTPLSRKNHHKHVPKRYKSNTSTKYCSVEKPYLLVNGLRVPVKDKNASMTWDDFHRLDVIYEFLNRLEDKHPASCTVFNIGKTAEKRDIKLINISNGNAANHSVWIDAGIHGREWIAPAVCTYIIKYLARNFTTLPTYLTNKDWYIVPVLNPDGYEFSHTKDRMWRKNRTRYTGITGVDINRNFSVGWRNVNKPQNFSGPSPFSEYESLAVRNMLINTDVTYSIYISLHCYGQLILFPYSHTTALCNDYVRLLEGASHMSKAVYETTGINYKVGISKDIMYGACGTSTDWAYEIAKIPFCYTIELRNTVHRFSPPGDKIKECGKEILSCIAALMKYFDNEGHKFVQSKGRACIGTGRRVEDNCTSNKKDEFNESNYGSVGTTVDAIN